MLRDSTLRPWSVSEHSLLVSSVRPSPRPLTPPSLTSSSSSSSSSRVRRLTRVGSRNSRQSDPGLHPNCRSYVPPLSPPLPPLTPVSPPAISGTIKFLKNDRAIFECHPIEKSRLIFQLGSADPELAVQAARMVMGDVAGVGLNCGCPKPFSLSGGMGAELLKLPNKLCAVRSLSLTLAPVTWGYSTDPRPTTDPHRPRNPHPPPHRRENSSPPDPTRHTLSRL